MQIRPISDLRNKFTEIEKVVRRYIGSQELIKGDRRYCIYINEEQLPYVVANKEIQRRAEIVRNERLKSKKEATRVWAEKPFYFMEDRVIDEISIEVARVSGWVSDFVEYQVIISPEDIDLYRQYNKDFNEHFEFFNYDFGLVMSELSLLILVIV